MDGFGAFTYAIERLAGLRGQAVRAARHHEPAVAQPRQGQGRLHDRLRARRARVEDLPREGELGLAGEERAGETCHRVVEEKRLGPVQKGHRPHLPRVRGPDESRVVHRYGRAATRSDPARG